MEEYIQLILNISSQIHLNMDTFQERAGAAFGNLWNYFNQLVNADRIKAINSFLSLKENYGFYSKLYAAFFVTVILIWIFMLIKKRRLLKSTGNLDIYDLAKTAYEKNRANQVLELLHYWDRDINESNDGLNLLMCACLSGEKKLIMNLIRRGADIQAKTLEGDGVLYLATYGVVNSPKPDVTVLQELIRRGCNVNEQNENGYTPLHRAAAKGNLEVIKCLLSYGAVKGLKNNAGKYPTDTALNAGNDEAAKLLQLEDGEQANDPNHTPKNSSGLTGILEKIAENEYLETLTRSALRRRSMQQALNVNNQAENVNENKEENMSTPKKILQKMFSKQSSTKQEYHFSDEDEEWPKSEDVNNASASKDNTPQIAGGTITNPIFVRGGGGDTSRNNTPQKQQEKSLQYVADAVDGSGEGGQAVKNLSKLMQDSEAATTGSSRSSLLTRRQQMASHKNA